MDEQRSSPQHAGPRYAPRPALSARFHEIAGLAVDADGALFVSDARLHRVYRITPDGLCFVFTGTGALGHADGPVATATLGYPRGIAIDAAGNLYIADSGNACIRRVTPAGIVETVAGGREDGYADGPGAEARFYSPGGVAIDGAGTIFVFDEDNSCVRRIAPDGMVSTVAGWGRPPGPEYTDEHEVCSPERVAVDPAGNLYVFDRSRRRVDRIAPDGAQTVIALDAKYRDMPRAMPEVLDPHSIACDERGNLYVGDRVSRAVYRLDLEGRVRLVFAPLEPLPGNTQASGETFPHPSVMAAGGGAVYLASGFDARVWRIGPDGNAALIAGGSERARLGGYADGPAVTARFRDPAGIAVDTAGVIYVADTGNHCIRRIAGGTGETFAGAPEEGFGDGPASEARFSSPHGLAFDHTGNLLVADQGNGAIRRISPAGLVSTVDWTPPETPRVQRGELAPHGVAVDSRGRIFFSDDNERVCAIGPDGVLDVIAGGAAAVEGGEWVRNGPGAVAWFDGPHGLAFDRDGSLLIAEFMPDRLRRVSPDGYVSTIAGERDGSDADPVFFGPNDVAIAPHGTIYCIDWYGQLYRVSGSGELTVVAGGGGYAFADGRGEAAYFCGPYAIAIGADGTIYVADTGNHRIRRVDLDGTVTTIAGSGEPDE